MHGTHQVAQKFITTTLPSAGRVDRRTIQPVDLGRQVAGWPTRLRGRRCALVQKRQELLRVAGRPGEGRDHVLVGIQDGVNGSATVWNFACFQLFVLFGGGVGAVGVQLHQHEVLAGRRRSPAA